MDQETFIENSLRQIEQVLIDQVGEYIDFENGAFAFHYYTEAGCDCPETVEHLDNCDEKEFLARGVNDCCSCPMTIHKKDCIETRPNFRCGEFEVHWYKHIGRGMSWTNISDEDLKKLCHNQKFLLIAFFLQLIILVL